jgi:hypothetical protein
VAIVTQNAWSTQDLQRGLYRDITRYMNRAAVAEHLKQTQEMLANLLALLEAGEADKFAAHLYQSRRQYRRISERPKGQQGSRTRDYFKLPDRAEPGIQGRLSCMGALAARSRVKTQSRTSRSHRAND